MPLAAAPMGTRYMLPCFEGWLTTARISAIASALAAKADAGQRLLQPGDILAIAPMLDDLEAAPSHGGAAGGRGEHVAKGLGQRIGVAHGHDGAVLAGMHEIGAGADLVADDDGAARIHRLVDHETPGLLARGQHEEIGGIIEGGQLALIAEAREKDAIGDTELACPR